MEEGRRGSSGVDYRYGTEAGGWYRQTEKTAEGGMAESKLSG